MSFARTHYSTTQSSSSKKTDPITVHYKTGKHNFEVAIVHESGVLDRYRAAPSASLLTQVLETDKIFTNFQKGQVASIDELRNCFDMKSTNEIFDIILREGVAHVPTGDKRAAAAAHRETVVLYLHENYVNSKTRLPIDITELNQAIDAHKVHIPDGEAVTAAASVAHSLLGVVTLKEGDITGSVELKAELVGPAMNIIHKFTRIKNESQTWFGDEMKYRVSIKPGDYSEFRSQLDKLTKGHYQFVLGQLELHDHDSSSSSSSSSPSHQEKDHASLKLEERVNSKAAQLAEAVIKQEQKKAHDADEARSRKQNAEE